MAITKTPLEFGWDRCKEVLDSAKAVLTTEEMIKSAFYLGATTAHEAHHAGLGVLVRAEVDRFSADPRAVCGDAKQTEASH